MSSPDNCKNYHHGDLRNALIIAAAELIEENGSVDFAMIDAARRAGVSSAAPYRHFKDKDALVDGVAQLAFLALRETVEAVSRSMPIKMKTALSPRVRPISASRSGIRSSTT